jgi:hypothetical protein
VCPPSCKPQLPSLSLSLSPASSVLNKNCRCRLFCTGSTTLHYLFLLPLYLSTSHSSSTSTSLFSPLTLVIHHNHPACLFALSPDTLVTRQRNKKISPSLGSGSGSGSGSGPGNSSRASPPIDTVALSCRLFSGFLQPQSRTEQNSRTRF